MGRPVTSSDVVALKPQITTSTGQSPEDVSAFLVAQNAANNTLVVPQPGQPTPGDLAKVDYTQILATHPLISKLPLPQE